MKKTIAKVNKTNSWFFEKIIKTHKPLARLIKKKRERTKINIVINEREVTAYITEIQTIIEYYRELYDKNWTA